MLISLNWINDFVHIKKYHVHDLANKLTMSTAEVESVTTQQPHPFSVIELVKIESIRPHPNADKLNLVTFSNGKNSKEVVCGAPNVKNAMVVAYAPTGTTLPNGLSLEPKKIRGIVSEGMLCSGDELNLEPTPQGLMEFADDAPVGKKLSEYLGVTGVNEEPDTLVEIDNKSLTHRPDLWGIAGMAREFAAITGEPLQNLYGAHWTKKIESEIQNNQFNPMGVELKEESSCLSFWGISMDGVKIEPSPVWMQQRLEAVGLRPINNIVDISNYVMMELGHPLHIYDREKIQGDLKVYSLKDEQTFVTLDEVTRKLLPGDTVIADSENNILVLAGIMGGQSSGVSDHTCNVFIEVANWKSAAVRKTSTRLGLRTDSSMRYEKGLDSHQTKRTLFRVIELIKKLCPDAKVIGQPVYQGVDLNNPGTRVITTHLSRINGCLGTDLKLEKVKDILHSLDFQVEHKSSINDDAGELKVVVPSYRAMKDITIEADLFEEVGRMIGYDNISPQAPFFSASPVKLQPLKLFERKTQDFLASRVPSLEIMTYPLVGDKILERAQWPKFPSDSVLKLVNALSSDADQMRSSLIPSALDAAALNWKNFSDFSFFELGRVFTCGPLSSSSQNQTHTKGQSKGKKNHGGASAIGYPQNLGEHTVTEQRHLLLALASKKLNRFVELINNVEDLLSYHGLSYKLLDYDYSQVKPIDKCKGADISYFAQNEKNARFLCKAIPSDWSGVHPIERVDIQLLGKTQGVMFSVHPYVLKKYKMKGHLHFALIDYSFIENLKAKDSAKFRTLNHHPSSTFDCSVVASAPVAQVLKPLQGIKNPLFSGSQIAGIFPLGNNTFSVTVRSVFSAQDRTLGPDEIRELEQKVVSTLDQAGYPLKT